MKQNIILGDIFKVRIKENLHIYGRVLNYGDYAFYDYKTNCDEKDIEIIISKPILFIAIVEASAIERKRWKIVGHKDLDFNLLNISKYKLQNIVSGTYRIIDRGNMRNSTKEECEGLEYGFVWNAEQIEERIMDFYEGKTNEHILAFEKLMNRFKE